MAWDTFHPMGWRFATLPAPVPSRRRGQPAENARRQRSDARRAARPDARAEWHRHAALGSEKAIDGVFAQALLEALAGHPVEIETAKGKQQLKVDMNDDGLIEDFKDWSSYGSSYYYGAVDAFGPPQEGRVQSPALVGAVRT